MKLQKRISTMALTTLIMSGFMTDIITAESINNNERTLFISPGEFPNKAGKRSDVAKDLNLDPNKYPLYDDGTLGEYYINVPFVQKISEYVRAKDNTIQVVEYYRQGKGDDLNAIGRKAGSSGADIYLSIHTNSSDKRDKSGYLAMTNANKTDFKNSSDEIAKAIASEMDDEQIPFDKDRKDGLALSETKIGELNEASKNMPSALIEVGYYTNPEELKNLTDPTYINTVANRIAEAIVKELQSGKYDNDQVIESIESNTESNNASEETEKPVIESGDEPPSTIEEENINVVQEEPEEEKESILDIFKKNKKKIEDKYENMSLEELEIEYQKSLEMLKELEQSIGGEK